MEILVELQKDKPPKLHFCSLPWTKYPPSIGGSVGRALVARCISETKVINYKMIIMRPNFLFSLEPLLEANVDLTWRHGRNFWLDISGKIWALSQGEVFLYKHHQWATSQSPCFSSLIEAMDDVAISTQLNTTRIVGIIICSSIQTLPPSL